MSRRCALRARKPRSCGARKGRRAGAPAPPAPTAPRRSGTGARGAPGEHDGPAWRRRVRRVTRRRARVCAPRGAAPAAPARREGARESCAFCRRWEAGQLTEAEQPGRASVRALSAVLNTRACSYTFGARTHSRALALSVDSQQAPGWLLHAHAAEPLVARCHAVMSARPAWVGLGLPEEASAPAFRSDGGSSDGVNDHLRRELAARGGESTTLRLGSEAAASVDAYIEYRRIVGDADGGVLFSGALLFGALYASAKC